MKFTLMERRRGIDEKYTYISRRARNAMHRVAVPFTLVYFQQSGRYFLIRKNDACKLIGGVYHVI